MQAPAAGAGPASLLTPLGAAYYVKSKTLDVAHYQALIDRGWRRSGTLLYKPDVRRACCPHYTIRLPAASFKPTRDQRQAVNRWNRFVLGDSYLNEAKKLHPKTKEEKAKQRNGFNLYDVIHEAEDLNVKRPPEPAHRFEVTLEPDSFTDEKFQLFSNYQQAVHHEEAHKVTQGGFRRFLCDSPLQRRAADGSSTRLGSFHQCYRLDGRLIAIAVLDLLPHAVSGVYFIYHSDFEKYSLGKISALREAVLAEELGLHFYYMGYYIHNCKKMRYKGEYQPQYVLDPESYEWNELNGELRALLDEKKYVSLSRQRQSKGAKVLDNGGDTPMPEASSDDDFDGKHLDSPVLAAAAADDGLSLMELGVPGVLKVDELLEKISLDKIKIGIPSAGIVADMEDLVTWDKGTITDKTSLKGHIAEMAACLGPEVAKEMIVQLGG
ncbi:arginine-trna-protein transferase [Diplodia corticola]|uniref:Arginyl-tRNA--protein transferase 1 n=1 Tax=Diplodia corticola TaxID=236234 RepID=A0A1J9R2A1_9PEZI|nr:arginine-trna-protein transferase [Diplodia corticola]OJD35518.1 arginine-trna-protein transferase [Diplodia corticola]